jgi:hypothetical protein
MTLEEAKEECPTIDYFIQTACDCCTANDWYCPSLCHDLEKAERIPFEKIQAAYARHDGDMKKVFNYIKQRR